MIRKFIFKDSAAQSELQLPITPPSFDIDHGIGVETINIDRLGEVHLPGKRTMMTIRIDCMFPAKQYPFAENVNGSSPYQYIQKLEGWCDAGTVIRFMISDTPVNTTAIIESVRFGEQDGTNDVYATITLRQYRVLKSAGLSSEQQTGNQQREEEQVKTGEKTYQIVSGDTLSGICRKFYGNPNLYSKLAAYNGIKNPDLIYAGASIKIPDVSAL